MAATEQLFNVRERKRFERHDIWERIAENGTISAAVMVYAAIAAVICANTDAYEAIHHFLETPLYVGLGNLTAGLTVELFVNDFLMAIFFLLVGIELKYEMTVGELKNPRQAMLPMLAAVGGVVVPACIYLIFNHAGAHNGWAIPMATDIAFALGVLSLLGNRVPNGVRVFFSTLAIADDLISIAAIAIFMVLSFVIANIVGRIRHYDAAMLESCRNAFMFNNTGNLGVALIILVFSHDPFVVNGQTPYLAEAMVVQIIIFMIQSVALNTLGLYQAGRGKLTARDTLAVMLRMPLLYVLGASLLARNVGLDAENFFLWPIMAMASKALLPLAMVSIGAQLSQTKIHWLDKDVWIVSILKMTALPLLGLAMIYGANAFRPGTFTAVSATVFLIYCAIPTAVNTALFAIEFDNNPDYATQIVMNTTALSAISLTFYIFLGHILFV